MSANTLYRASPLETFVLNVSKRSTYQHVIGDYEGARSASQRAPVIWRHPVDRYILEAGPVTDHRSEVDPFCEVKETLEMIVTAEDYTRALHMLIEIWRLAFDAAALERAEVDYIAAIDYGKVRRPRTNEAMPRGVPAAGFTLIDLVTLTWLAPRQIEAQFAVESVTATGKMYEGDTLQGTIEAPTP